MERMKKFYRIVWSRCESGRFCLVTYVLVAMLALLSSAWSASKDKVLYSFTNGDDGGAPRGILLWHKGSLYGIANGGGTTGNGVVFRLTPASGSWIETVVYSFSGGSDGAGPQAGLIADGAGNLYGITAGGGGTGCWNGCGTVFELSSSAGGTWSETVLYRFTGGADGGTPTGRLVLDAAGNLYGATQSGGELSCSGVESAGCGTVFELERGSSGEWTESVLHAFAGGPGDGAAPLNMDLTFDGAGHLFGTTEIGGANGFGAVFELFRDTSGKWKTHLLHSFRGGNDGATPSAGVILFNGNLFGTTYAGGNGCFSSVGCGIVFELTHSNSGWTEKIIHRFHFSDGDGPTYSLLGDSAGNLYGTVFDGGSGSCSVCGTAYELSPSANGAWKETMVYHFGSSLDDAGTPLGGFIRDKAGNLFGTTELGGTTGQGTVYEITP